MKDMQHEFVAKTKIITFVGGPIDGKTSEVDRRTKAYVAPRQHRKTGEIVSAVYCDTGKRDVYGFAVFEVNRTV